jgi:hypothetical protein
MSGPEQSEDTNLRSPTYYLVQSITRCRHCGGSSGVVALALPPSHEVLTEVSPDDIVHPVNLPTESWEPAGANALLLYVTNLSRAVERQMSRMAPLFRRSASEATHNSYWANHCEHCAGLLEDHELHCEPEGAFVACSEGAASAIQLTAIDEPFEGIAAGYSMEPEFFSCMRRF